MDVRTEYLRRRIAALVRQGQELEKPEEWLDEDAQDLILETAEFLRGALDVPRIDAELVTRSRINTDTIKRVLGWLDAEAAKTPPAIALTLPDGTAFEWKSRLAGLHQLVDGLVATEALEELEVALRIGVAGEGPFETLLVCLEPASEVRAKVAALLEDKLAIASDAMVMDLWARLRAEVDSSREVYIEVDPSVAPSDFFDLGDPKPARVRIAQYLARVRPLLERRMLERGVSRFPGGTIGALTVLSWTTTPSTHAWSTTDRVAIRSLGRVCDCWTGQKTDLATALGVPLGGYFVDGRAEREARRSRDLYGKNTQAGPGARRALSELDKLVSIAEQREIQPERPVEKALREHKLGLEAVAPDVLAGLTKRDELFLQRQLLRFLIERGIPSYGTKIGWSETDVRSEDRFGAVVIETKVIRSSTLSAGMITKWLTQLGCYMDQEHAAVRGALVFYNFGDVPIFAPRTTLRYRYLIVAINLCKVSPSKRGSSIQIEGLEEGPDLVRVLRLGKVNAGKRSASSSRRRSGL